MNFSKDDIKALRADLKACEALTELAEKYGCEFKIDKIKYNEIDAEIGLVFVKKGDNEMSAEQNEFNRYAPMFGFKPEHYGFTFENNGKYYTLYGFNLKARKNYCKIRCEGKTYVCSPEQILCRIKLFS